MHRLPALLCAIALLGAVSSGALFFRIGKSKQILEQRLVEATVRAGQLDRQLALAHERNGGLETRLNALDTQLSAAQTRVAAGENRAAQLATDLRQTREVLALYESTARALADDVATLRRELDETRASQLSPEALAGYRATIAELERQLSSARDGAALPTAVGASTAVFTNRAGRATVLTVGPESAFVVLNFGSERGAALGQRLSVSQGTAEVATVLISDVRPNLSVAHVLPDTLRGALQKGDSAVLIR